MPKVSIVLPSLNVASYIEECILSVINQTLSDIEIICVDAGSTDGTLEILKEYEQKDSRIKVIHSEKRSYGYQVNLGMDFATGEYFAIVETDDYIAPTMYRDLCEIADREKLDFVKADFYRFTGDGKARVFSYANIARKLYYRRILNPANDPSIMSPNTVYSWAGIYRLDFLQKNAIRHNETPGAAYQDNGFWFQTFSQANRIQFVGKPYYHLRRDNPNSSFCSKAKVYCACEEYDFIREFLRKDSNIERKFVGICAYYRYKNYQFTYDRISDEFKKEFIVRFAEDFRKIQVAGELEERWFPEESWLYLQKVMSNPEEVYYERSNSQIPTDDELKGYNLNERIEVLQERLKASNAKLNVLAQEFMQVQSTPAYRVGTTITWLPNSVCRAIRYCHKHGLKEAVNRLLSRKSDR